MEIVPQLIVNGLIAGAIYALLAIAFTLVYSTGKFFNLALGALVPVGGYATLALFERGLPLAVAIPLGILVAAVLGGAFELVIFRQLRMRHASSLVLIIASLGVATAAQAILALLFSSQLQLLPKIGDAPLSFGGASFTLLHVWTVVLASVGTVSVVALLRFTAFGRAVRAVSDDADVAAIVGINVNRIQLLIACIAGGFAGLAGILVGFDLGVEPTMGLHYFLAGVVGAIVGGIGMIGAGYAGSLIEGVLENTSLLVIPGEWKSAISFTLFIIILLARPQGLFKKEVRRL